MTATREPTATVLHGRIRLALHRLRDGEGRPLLLLHGLGLHTPDAAPPELEGWPGPIWGLDFTGHGASTVPQGGGYTAEILFGDVDAAIEHLGPVTLVGRGLGAYVALIAVAGRVDAVHGAILTDGPGIAGGGPAPGTPHLVQVDPKVPAPPDPWALGELSRDLRPPDYAVQFARLAVELSEVGTPIAVCARTRPEWLSAVAEEPGVLVTSLEEALGIYGG